MEINEIKDTKFLKQLNEKQLYKLSDDIREFLIDSVSKTGGHLSSNLGVVELTVALHKVFDSPKDQIFFDVGHQCYIHKILTGRANKFDKLRQKDGLSGFIKNKESAHDLWEAGHASTSISGALGYKLGKNLKNEDGYVIALIGDASIGGGLTFEALNHIGELNENVIIILNDNEMGISKPIGGLTKSLSKVRYSSKYYRFKRVMYNVLRKVPFGKRFVSYLIRVKANYKRNVYKDSLIFNGLGLEYYGPVDGHSYEELISALTHIKKLDKPVVLHVKTIKGKGYEFAEKDINGNYHGVAPFDVNTGVVKKTDEGIENWSNIIIWTIEDLALNNEDLVVITPAMENGSMLKKFKEKFPNRYIDVGIAEEHAVTLSAGLSLANAHPIISIYSTFLQRSYDQIIHDVCRTNSKLILCVDRSGIVGEDGDTHQGIYDVAFLKTIPNLVICMPKDAIEAQHLMSTCVMYNGPIAIRYPRGKAKFEKVSEYENVEIGKWEIIKEGSNKVIISYGPNVVNVQDYAVENNVDIGIVNARFINPIDKDMLKDICNKYQDIYVYEEVISNNNLYSDIIKYVYENRLDVNVHSICLPDEYIEQGECMSILEKYGLDVKSVFEKLEV